MDAIQQQLRDLAERCQEQDEHNTSDVLSRVIELTVIVGNLATAITKANA